MFPLKNYTNTIPEGDHPGAFGALRKYDIHTGVDLYCDPGDDVYAMEDGLGVGVEDFTGPKADSPWWNDTKAVLVQSKSGIILYGEIEPKDVSIGQRVKCGEKIGEVKTVLKKDKGKPMTMLHMELYKPVYLLSPVLAAGSVWWNYDRFAPGKPLPQPERLLDVTDLLKEHYG
ncbi:MAG: M23 family metallopeptidase [Candidatus Nezhaarchaeales archaeon]